jgi:Smg protein
MRVQSIRALVLGNQPRYITGSNSMFDVLVYLYENYYRPDACPDVDTLARKLSAAGFEGEEINDALSWLSAITDSSRTSPPLVPSQALSFRVFSDVEYERLGSESIGFVHFLDSAGVLSPALRELIVERALATDESPVPIDKFKIIVLMVMWSQGEEPDGLILEELLQDDESPHLH